MEDKRNSQQIRYKERIKYGDAGRPNTEGHTYNISRTGIAIKSYKALSTGFEDFNCFIFRR